MRGENISIEGTAFRIFGNYFIKRKAKYNSLSDELMKARLFVPVEKWLSKALLYSIIAAVGAAVGFILMRGIIALMLGSAAFSVEFLDFVLSIVFAVIAFFVTFLSFYMLPRIKAWERKGKIDASLPYSIGYISSMASIGVLPYEIFKRLATAEDTYGEVSKEAGLVVRDVEVLGFDFITALKALVAVTPSTNMRAFVQGAVTTALSGGEMGSYFISTAKEYMSERRKKYEDFIEMLGLFAEFYVVGLVMAPLLLVVVMAMMSFLGSASLESLAAIVYLFIPFGSAAFIIFLGTLSEE